MRPHRVCTLLVLSLSAFADVAIRADGSRFEVDKPAKDSTGRWMGTIDGRRQALKPGEIVALVDERGEETSLTPELAPQAMTAAQAAALASVGDPRDEAWFASLETLASPPTRAAHDALVELAQSGKKDVKVRVVAALARMRTRESSLAAARAVLDEKDAKVRRDAAASLFSVREILRRSDAAELVTAGLADKDKLVRVEFALVAPLDMPQASEVLRKDGLAHGDHHVRESAAVELGRRGDASGMTVLAAMLARNAMPGMEDDPEMGARYLVAEQVEICGILARLGGDKARAALTKAQAKSPHDAVRAAAERALASLK